MLKLKEVLKWRAGCAHRKDSGCVLYMGTNVYCARNLQNGERENTVLDNRMPSKFKRELIVNERLELDKNRGLKRSLLHPKHSRQAC